MSKIKPTIIQYPKILIYDDNAVNYIEGYISEICSEPIEIDCTSINDTTYKTYTGATTHMELTISNAEQVDCVKLDPTLMKRIAKYNKQQECKQLDKIIKEKEEVIANKNKEIEELDNLLKDKEKRWNKVKEYIKNIYDISVEEDDYDYEEEYDW